MNQSDIRMGFPPALLAMEQEARQSRRTPARATVFKRDAFESGDQSLVSTICQGLRYTVYPQNPQTICVERVATPPNKEPQADAGGWIQCSPGMPDLAAHEYELRLKGCGDIFHDHCGNPRWTLRNNIDNAFLYARYQYRIKTGA